MIKKILSLTLVLIMGITMGFAFSGCNVSKEWSKIVDATVWEFKKENPNAKINCWSGFETGGVNGDKAVMGETEDC